MLCLFTTGFALLLLTAAANTLLQTSVPDDKRGRVMSLYTMAVTGLSPVGGLLGGLLAEQIGAPLTLRLAGLACLGGFALFAFCGVPRSNSVDQADSRAIPFLKPAILRPARRNLINSGASRS